MNLIKIFFLIVLISVATRYNAQTSDIKHSVNAVIGDISYIARFNTQPNDETDETTRLQTHLQFIEQLLRNKDVSSLTTEQKANRNIMLNLLQQYWKAGVFPKNYDYANRRIPCFIDKDGNICAVGYLIEQTVGRAVAEEINAKFKYEYLLEMNDIKIDNWIEASGLTKEECAMIQPSYGPYPSDPDNLPKGYAVSSSLIGGLNIALNTMNGIQISKGANNKLVPVLGIVSGAGQMLLGFTKYPKPIENWGGGRNINGAQRNLSMVNIGVGTSTIILSGVNMILNRKAKQKSLAMNVYSFPTQESNLGFGLCVKKRL